MEVRIGSCPLGAKCEEVKEEEGRQILYRCPWYILVRGTNPNTGEDIDDWNCAIAWHPILQIETSKEVRQGAAATESFRNIMFRLASGESPEQIMRSEYKRLPKNGG